MCANGMSVLLHVVELVAGVLCAVGVAAMLMILGAALAVLVDDVLHR